MRISGRAESSFFFRKDRWELKLWVECWMFFFTEYRTRNIEYPMTKCPVVKGWAIPLETWSTLMGKHRWKVNIECWVLNIFPNVFLAILSEAFVKKCAERTIPIKSKCKPSSWLCCVTSWGSFPHTCRRTVTVQDDALKKVVLREATRLLIIE